jgi:hypothetical protein
MSSAEWKQANAEKMREYRRTHYANNKEAYSSNVLKRKKETQEWLRSLKAGKSCRYCTESYAACLDYHHRDGTEKKFNIAKAATNGYSRETILKEIAKCDLICANCHRKLHDGFYGDF